MTLIEAISRIDILKPNGYSQSEKVKWLSVLDGIINSEIINTHEGAEKVTFNGYDDSTSLTTELLVPSPYDIIYFRWLETQIDYANGEYAKYNNGVQAYNDAYTAFERHYNRTHMPLGKKFKFW